MNTFIRGSRDPEKWQTHRLKTIAGVTNRFETERGHQPFWNWDPRGPCGRPGARGHHVGDPCFRVCKSTPRGTQIF